MDALTVRNLTWVKCSSPRLDLIAVTTGIYKVVVIAFQIFAKCLGDEVIDRVVQSFEHLTPQAVNATKFKFIPKPLVVFAIFGIA